MVAMNRYRLVVAFLGLIVIPNHGLRAQTEGADRPASGPVKVVPSIGAIYETQWRHPDVGFRNPDGTVATVQTFDSPEKVDFASVDWQRSQIEWMMEAGLDFFTPIWRYRADLPDSEGSLRAEAALGAILKAEVQIIKDGGNAPRLALYIDAEMLRRESDADDLRPLLDLRIPGELRIFEESIFHYFRLVPKALRWELDGFPLLVFGPAPGVSHDRELFEKIGYDFAAEFQSKPYIIADPSWQSRPHARWQAGAALYGPPATSEVQTLGPGYDDTRVPGRGTPIRKREDGRFYEWSWNKVLLANPTLVLIESWNLFQEGSGIAPCKEYGDFYVQLTRRYVARLKGGVLPDLARPVRIAYPDPIPRPDEGWFTMQAGLDRVFHVAQNHASNFGFGLRLVGVDDGPFSRGKNGDKAVIEFPASPDAATYLYLGIADEFAHRIGASYEIEVVARGEAGSELTLQYDSWDSSAALKGAYKSAPKQVFTDSLIHKIVWQLPDPRFGNRQNAGADFRLAFKGKELSVLGVQVRRLPEKMRSDKPILELR